MQNMPNRVASIAMRMHSPLAMVPCLKESASKQRHLIGRAGHLKQLADRETIAARLGLTG